MNQFLMEKKKNKNKNKKKKKRKKNFERISGDTCRVYYDFSFGYQSLNQIGEI